MYAILNVLKDMKPVVLCFSNKKSAENFLVLVNTYEDDSGAGNGHSAYWPNYDNQRIQLRFWQPSGSLSKLNVAMVEGMLWRIYSARDAAPPDDMEKKFSIRCTDKAITFSLEELPPRIRPTVGDMYRIPRSLSQDGMGGEGKVIDDAGSLLQVIPWWYWERDGFRRDVKASWVKASETMKTHDWLQTAFPERTSWVFDPSMIPKKP